MDGKANPLMDRKLVGVVLFGVVAAATSITTAGYSAAQGVVQNIICSCSCSCSCIVVVVKCGEVW